MRQRTLLILALASLLAACDDNTPATPTPTPTPAVTSVTVAPASASVQAGQTTTLAATVNADAGVTNRTVTWSSSDTTVATVDSGGVVTGVASGTATIRATSAANTNIAGTSAITVTPRPVAFADFNGLYRGGSSIRNDGCNLGGPDTVTGELNIGSTGVGTFISRFSSTGQSIRFEVQTTLTGSTLTFRSTTSDSVNGAATEITYIATITANTLSAEELFSAGCETRYILTLTKQ